MTTIFDAQLTTLLKNKIAEQALPSHFFDVITNHLLPIAKKINSYKKNQHKPIIISFNGAQGSGKSTLTYFISLLLNHYFKQESISLSLDDFYLTKHQRIKLAHDIHPLLLTRGVPGTHDIQLAITTLAQLKICSPQNPCFIPQFDKASDDRSEIKNWQKVERPIDIILFEGWCNHAPIESEDELLTPINTLERNEDTLGIWRSYVNEQLKLYHQQLFSLCHLLYFIKIPNFEKTYEWRSLQEKKLKVNNSDLGMKPDELIRFIQHFERISRQCLDKLSNTADTIISLDENHQIKKVINNN